MDELEKEEFLLNNPDTEDDELTDETDEETEDDGLGIEEEEEI